MAFVPPEMSARRSAEAAILRRSQPRAHGWHAIELLSGLANVASFELELPECEVKWHSPFAGALKHVRNVEKFSMPSAMGERFIPLDELDEALIAPVAEVLRAGIACDNYELIQQIRTASGEERQMLVRVVCVGDDRYLGIIADVSDPADTPWVIADVADRLQLLVEHSPDGIVVHEGGRIVYANPAAAALVGEPSPRIGLGRDITAYLHPDHVGPTIARLALLKKPGAVVKGHEAVLRRIDGSDVPVEVASSRTTWGGKDAYQVILRDISERKRAEKEAEARLVLQQQYAAAAESLEEGVVVLGAGGRVVVANQSARRILGRRLQGAKADTILTGGKRARREDGTLFRSSELPIRQALRDHVGVSNCLIGVSDDRGEPQWLSVNVRPIDEAMSADRVAVCSISDVTERKGSVDRLEWEARNDPLSGLSNRNGFLAALRSVMERPDSELEGLVVFFFNLDRFKLVNEALGHVLGDEVLRVVSHRLHSVCRDAICTGRLDGDEFAVIERSMFDDDVALQRAELLRSEVSKPITLSNRRLITVPASVGLVRIADVRGEASDIVSDAAIAMQQAKQLPGGGVAIFDAALRDETESRLELENDLRSAIGKGKLRLEYQPIASLVNNRVVGFEALARWEHPTRGPLPPTLFIPLAEESALINELGEWALRTACKQMADWQRQYAEARNCYVAVNVSSRQIVSPDLLPAVRLALDESELSAGSLQLEITESGFISDRIDVIGVLRELSDLGIRLSIDDFGTGFSSLSYLKHLPISYLKIDRSFVMGLGSDRQDERIVAAVAQLGHGLHLRIVAEGVENRQQRLVAKNLGCDLYQGYLLARPCRARDVPDVWRSASKGSTRNAAALHDSEMGGE